MYFYLRSTINYSLSTIFLDCEWKFFQNQDSDAEGNSLRNSREIFAENTSVVFQKAHLIPWTRSVEREIIAEGNFGHRLRVEIVFYSYSCVDLPRYTVIDMTGSLLLAWTTAQWPTEISCIYTRRL